MNGANYQRRLAVLMLGAILGACSSPNPTLYTIAPVAGSEQSDGPKVVLLQQIGLDRYLERSQIVRSSENYRLDVMANDWWGEPLSAMLSRVLVTELSQRLPRSTVISENGAVSAPADATIELNVQRPRQGRVRHSCVARPRPASCSGGGMRPPCKASGSLRARRHPTHRERLRQSGTAVGQLADGLAAMVRRRALGTIMPLSVDRPITRRNSANVPAAGCFRRFPRWCLP